MDQVKEIKVYINSVDSDAVLCKVDLLIRDKDTYQMSKDEFTKICDSHLIYGVVKAVNFKRNCGSAFDEFVTTYTLSNSISEFEDLKSYRKLIISEYVLSDFDSAINVISPDINTKPYDYDLYRALLSRTNY